MESTNFINDLMTFNPSDLSVFQKEEQSTGNANIYKTSPMNSKAEDGHYRSRVKVLYNPFDVKQSIVKSVRYAMNDANGFFLADSKLAIGDRDCPIFKAWKKLHFSNDPECQEQAKKMFQKTEARWCLVQIIEDDNAPELVGQFKAMKLPKAIFEKMDAKMNPSAESKKTPQALLDYLIGPILDIDVTPGPDDPTKPERKTREISYSLCDFDTDPSPIIKTDGKPLFTDEEIEQIEQYNNIKQAIYKAKTEKAKNEKLKELQAITEPIKVLYTKALDYMKENAIDIVKECGYKEWDEALTTRVNNWIEAVLALKDPSQVFVTEDKGTDPLMNKVTEGTGAEGTGEHLSEVSNDDVFNAVIEGDNDLPF